MKKKKKIYKYKFRGFHCDEDSCYGLLVCQTIRYQNQKEDSTDNISCLQHVYVWRRSPDWVLAPLTAYFLLIDSLASSTTLKLEAVGSSETSVNFFQSTLRHILRSNNLHSHHHKKFKSCLFIRIWSYTETSKYFCRTSELRIRPKKFNTLLQSVTLGSDFGQN
jgi:hypothetical protein